MWTPRFEMIAPAPTVLPRFMAIRCLTEEQEIRSVLKGVRSRMLCPTHSNRKTTASMAARQPKLPTFHVINSDDMPVRAAQPACRREKHGGLDGSKEKGLRSQAHSPERSTLRPYHRLASCLRAHTMQTKPKVLRRSAPGTGMGALPLPASVSIVNCE